jgi:hypothetical protein
MRWSWIANAVASLSSSSSASTRAPCRLAESDNELTGTPVPTASHGPIRQRFHWRAGPRRDMPFE